MATIFANAEVLPRGETVVRSDPMGRLKATAAAVLIAGVALVACTGGSDDAAPGTDASIETGAPGAAEAPTATATTAAVVDQPERDQQVNEFLDAVESDANCISVECLTAQATYGRYRNLYELAGEIPGDDILPYVTAMSSAWDAWNDCLSAAESRFERFDCAEESDMEQAITDLYDALRELG